MNATLHSALRCLQPRGLFLRVFFTIGVSVLVSALLSLGLFSFGTQRNLERILAQDYSDLSEQVRQALDNGNLSELQASFREDQNALLVVLEGGRPLGTRPPGWMIDKLRRGDDRRGDNRGSEDRASERNGDDRRGGDRRTPHQNAQSPEGERHRRPPPPEPPVEDDWRGPRDFELMQSRFEHRGLKYRIIILPQPSALRDAARPLGLLGFVAMLTLASSLIAWMFSKPLRVVQSAARQLSTGDTSARVDAKITKRRDSIGELGRDFNVMASRIQHLLDAQQQLLRDVSHELRTPLARMQVALVLAQDNPRHTGTQLERIDTEIERLDALIGTILSLTKVETGATQLDEESFDLGELLQQLAQDAEYEFSNTGVTADIHCPAIHLFGDRQQLRSALENVVRNAMRYSPEKGQIALHVQQHPSQLTISVRDWGPGVEEAQLDRLFEPFYRIEKARSAQSSGGHGVGLAIVRSIVLLHDGEISASNAPGGGLEITIKLPNARRHKP